jgi:hypothetical protein
MIRLTIYSWHKKIKIVYFDFVVRASRLYLEKIKKKAGCLHKQDYKHTQAGLQTHTNRTTNTHKQDYKHTQTGRMPVPQKLQNLCDN